MKCADYTQFHFYSGLRVAVASGRKEAKENEEEIG
jgi:hypothetical protein